MNDTQLFECGCCRCSTCICQSKNDHKSSKKQFEDIETFETNGDLNRVNFTESTENVKQSNNRNDGVNFSGVRVLKNVNHTGTKSSEDEKEIVQIEPSEEHPRVHAKFEDGDLCTCMSVSCICEDAEDIVYFTGNTLHFTTPAVTVGSETEKKTSDDERNMQKMERTLVLVRPGALKYKEVILRAISTAGLDILSQRMVHLSPEQIFEIFGQYYGHPVFPYLATSLSLAPVLAISITGAHAISRWKCIAGSDGSLPENWFFRSHFRRKFGQTDVPEAILGSRDRSTAELENKYFFPDKIWDESLRNNKASSDEYLRRNINSALSQGLSLVARNKPADPILFLADLLLKFNPNQPQYSPPAYMSVA